MALKFGMDIGHKHTNLDETLFSMEQLGHV